MHEQGEQPLRKAGLVFVLALTATVVSAQSQLLPAYWPHGHMGLGHLTDTPASVAAAAAGTAVVVLPPHGSPQTEALAVAARAFARTDRSCRRRNSGIPAP